MKNFHVGLRRMLALLLTILMLAGSVPAGASSASFSMALLGGGQVNPGETISPDSKWINSDIIGSIDENTTVSIKDDFHTAVNMDRFLDEDFVSVFDQAITLLTDRKMDIVMGKAAIAPANADAVGLSSEWLAHDLELIQTFAALAGLWDERDALGIEPAVPFLEAIENISSLEEMSAYLSDPLLNIGGVSFFITSVMPEGEEDPVNELYVLPFGSSLLPSQDAYSYMNTDSLVASHLVDEQTKYLLGRFGYTESEVNRLLKQAYRFEARLADSMLTSFDQQTVNYFDSAVEMPLSELQALVGAYPITDTLTAYGLDPSVSVNVAEKYYFKHLSSLYSERHLEEIKALCIVGTVKALMPLLDSDAFESLVEFSNTIQGISSETDDDGSPETDQDVQLPEDFSVEELEERALAEFVFNYYINDYLATPLDQIYVAAYCTPELKENILQMTDEIIGYYREMLMNVSWLSQKARVAAVEKLDNIVIRAVYPDEFMDYTGLTFNGYNSEEPGTLPQAVAAINAFAAASSLAEVGQKVDRTAWDLHFISTTDVNAYYLPSENSVNILAGYVSEPMYDMDLPREVGLARVGTTIGHEITHAFDTTGYKYDKNGNMNPWWSNNDVEAFDLRSRSLIRFYDTITPYPGALFYSGSTVSGEVIADMGGVKSILGIAASDPEFDYELFFRSYAELWGEHRELELEQYLVSNDEHPLSFLRTNVTLQQFDEFLETFDIQPGDGMYLAPDKRINVW